MYLASCLGQEKAKGPFGLRVKLPPVYHLRWRLYIAWTSSKEAVNTDFYSLRFDPTGNRSSVNRFSTWHSIHSATDRLMLGKNFLAFYCGWKHGATKCCNPPGEKWATRGDRHTSVVFCGKAVFIVSPIKEHKKFGYILSRDVIMVLSQRYFVCTVSYKHLQQL